MPPESLRATSPLPRGPHSLSRAQVADSQRGRLIAALTELLADGGYKAVTIGALASKAGVSRGTFYEHFADKEACLMAAYGEFAADLLDAMTAGVEADAPWEDFVASALGAYLGSLERDPVRARAFIVEMDAAGEAARRRRREGAHGFAVMLAERHTQMRKQDPKLGELPDRAFLGLVLGVRDMAREQLEDHAKPALTALAPDILAWAKAMIRGA